MALNRVIELLRRSSWLQNAKPMTVKRTKFTVAQPQVFKYKSSKRVIQLHTRVLSTYLHHKLSQFREPSITSCDIRHCTGWRTTNAPLGVNGAQRRTTAWHHWVVTVHKQRLTVAFDFWKLPDADFFNNLWKSWLCAGIRTILQPLQSVEGRETNFAKTRRCMTTHQKAIGFSFTQCSNPNFQTETPHLSPQ